MIEVVHTQPAVQYCARIFWAHLAIFVICIVQFLLCCRGVVTIELGESEAAQLSASAFISYFHLLD